MVRLSPTLGVDRHIAGRIVCSYYIRVDLVIFSYTRTVKYTQHESRAEPEDYFCAIDKKALLYGI